MSRGLIFDCDGVLTDIEIDVHLRAFNQAFADNGIAFAWTAEGYAGALRISGGQERLRALFNDPMFFEAAGRPGSATEQRCLVERVHRRKTELFVRCIESRSVPARPGVRRLAEEAIAAGWRLAVASSAARSSVNAVLRSVMGQQLAARFDIVSGEMVRRKKPDPEVYRLATRLIDVPPEQCVVVEDTTAGLRAAKAIDTCCVVTPTAHTFHDDFSEAEIVVSSLGDLDGTQAITLGGRVWRGRTPHIDLSELEDLIRTRTARPGAA